MKMVIVTLSCFTGSGEISYDMEMPCQVPARPLIAHICQTINQYTEGSVSLQPQGLQLHCRRLNRALTLEETLENAGIWNGDHIDLK